MSTGTKTSLFVALLVSIGLQCSLAHAQTLAVPSSKAATAADFTHQDPTALAKSAEAAINAKNWSQALGLWDRYLVLKPDDAYGYLPMAALFDGEKFLAQRYQLALFTEAAKDKLKDVSKALWRFAGFGLTEKRENFDALPSVRGELEGMVAPGFAGDIKFDKDFTAASFKDGLGRRPPVVHIASHFVFKSGTEADSYLLLGDGSKLSLQAIKQGNLRFTDVDLVTLSACETAVGGGKDANGREVEGFGALAQNQGAKGVIATLWPVADQSTGQFMQLFYGYRQNNPGMTKAQAMQMAQNAFIEGKAGPALAEVSRGATRMGVGKAAAAVSTTDHPYYWAPFILMGNWL